MTPNASEPGNFGSLGAIFLFILLPCMWGLGLQKDPKVHAHYDWSVPTTPYLILLRKYRDTNGSRIVIQIGGVYTTFCQAKGILLQKYRDTNGR